MQELPCQECGNPIPKASYSAKMYERLKYCGRACGYKNNSKRPEHQCMKCHVVAGIGVGESARLSGRTKGAVSSWRKQHGLKTQHKSPYTLEGIYRIMHQHMENEAQMVKRAESCVCWSKHPLAIKERSRLAYYRNHEANKQRSKDAAKERYYRTINNPEVRLKRAMRNAIMRICRKSKTNKDRKTIDYLGCTMSHARNAIEKRFKPGMRWDNHGEAWEIDHIVPLSRFNLCRESHRMKANHINNLQPLWKHDNRAKADRYVEADTLVLV